MAQLDSLRAIGVMAVMAHHFFPQAIREFEIGDAGVRPFFVLSGFLITGILLRSRALVDSGAQRVSVAFRRFYARRFLRIFPLYYGVLAVGWLLRVPGIRNDLAWHAGYLSNLHFFLQNRWGGPVAHFWSLAVEEQFYLLWPVVVLLVPKRRLPAIVLGAMAAGPAFRLLATLWFTGNGFISTLTFSCLDSLGAGAYLAMSVDPGLRGHPLVRSPAAIGLWLGAPLVLACRVLERAQAAPLFVAVASDTAVALISVWLIARGVQGFKGFAGRVLDLKPLQYLGVISYGIYIYHPLVPVLVPMAARRLGHGHLFDALGNGETRTVWYLVVFGVISVLVAAASWRWYEEPIYRLKRRFEYAAPTRTATPRSGPAARPAGPARSRRTGPPGR
jgi:peptidoglycan/LPS O-acetylase OafA/YrhL